MKQYLALMQDIIDNGRHKANRTGVDTVALFGTQMRFNLADGFPLLTTKKVHLKSVIYELLWFMQGRTDIKWLQDREVTIWNNWHKYGSIGPGYGAQWRRWEEIFVVSPKTFAPTPIELKEGLVAGVGTGGEFRSESPDLYNTWAEMLHRCYNKNRTHYRWYGGRGVFVDPRWFHFPNFVADAKILDGWLLKLDNPSKFTLDKDFFATNKYGPETCIWSSADEQRLNTSRTSKVVEVTRPDGVSFTTMSVKRICQDYSLDKSTVYKCLRGERKETKRWKFKFVEVDGIARVRIYDQLATALAKLRHAPDDRRNIVSAWHVGCLDQMSLPPCHLLFQFDVTDGRLSCQMYQRSCDFFLGVPFNIASYALLTMMMARMSGLGLGDFIWTGGDTHLYVNHLDQTKLQLSREPRSLPKMILKYRGQGLDDWKYEDFSLINYNPHPGIKAEVAV